MRRKGIAPFLWLGMGVLVLGGGALALTSLGGVFTQFEGLLQFLFQNTISIITIVGFVGLVIIGVKNAGADDPKWRQDLTGLGVMLVAFLAITMLLPVVSGHVTGYQADMTINLNQGLTCGDSSVRSVEVENFQKTGPLAAIQTTFNVFGVVQCSASGDYRVSCGADNVVDRGSFTATMVRGTGGEVTKTITGLPQGETCEVTVEMDNGNTGAGTFTVPSG